MPMNRVPRICAAAVVLRAREGCHVAAVILDVPILWPRRERRGTACWPSSGSFRDSPALLSRPPICSMHPRPEDIHFLSVWIKRIHRIILTIHIRTDIIVLLRQRVNTRPHRYPCHVIPSGAEVVHVQAVHLVELLAVVSVWLHVVVSAAVAELRSERIVVHQLDDRSFPAAIDFPHLADVTQMVTVEVAEREVVLAVVAAVLPCLAVALLEPVFVYPAVLQRKAGSFSCCKHSNCDLCPFRCFI